MRTPFPLLIDYIPTQSKNFLIPPAKQPIQHSLLLTRYSSRHLFSSSGQYTYTHFLATCLQDILQMKTVEMESVRAPNADIISGNVAPEPAACKLTGPLTFLPATLNKPCADGTPTTSDAPLNILKPLENAPKGPSTAPIAPMIAPMSVQSKFTPINAKARKYKSSLFVSAVQSESEDHGATTATESEDVASDYAADHGNTTSEEVDTQRPVSAAVTPTVPLKGKKSRQTQPSKPIIKSLKRVRSRNDTTASRPSKRVRNTPLMRAAPRATPASTRVSKEFTSAFHLHTFQSNDTNLNLGILRLLSS